MAKEKEIASEVSSLRKRAEEIDRKKTSRIPENMKNLSPKEMKQLLHELRVHQIELEMQNEAMRTSQAELEATRMSYFDLYNLAPMGYCTVSGKGLILRVNLATAALLGETRDAPVNQPISSFIFKEDQDIYYLHRKKLFETYRPQTFELRMVKSDGTAFWAQMDISITEVAGTAISMSDITKRKRAEEELFQQRGLLLSVIESSSDAIFAKDTTGKYVSINESGAKMLGHRVADMIGRTDAEFLSAETASAFRTTDESVMSSGQVHEMEETGEFNGRTCVFLAHKAPWRDSSGKIIGVVGISNDITERKRLNEEKAKMEGQLQKIDSLTRMSGAVAHHFNNKLHVVLGYLEMVIGGMPPGDSSIINLKRAMESARNASNVSGNLLAYVGKARDKIELIDLAELCRMSLPVPQAGKPGKVDMETDLPVPGPLISADAKQIQQILTSLVINAWESIGAETGTIYMSVKTVSATDIPESCRHPIKWKAREQQYACLEVADSGCGILEKDMENLFDPFFSTKFVGRGLGLPMVIGIVQTHAGGITIESRIGGGSVFKVFFPLSAQKEDIHNKQVNKVPNIVAGGTVLLVEDEKSIREMTTIMLVRLGFTVLQAKDGVEAVEIFEKHKNEISCLLSDLAMPRMDGWETITAIRAIRHDLPVILASGYDEATVMAGEHPELPDVFLNKPYALNKLGDMIGRAMALEKERTLRTQSVQSAT